VATPVRSNVLRMHPYQPGKPISAVQRELGLKKIVKLASNENPLGPSPKAIAAVKSALSEVNRYPDGAAFELKNALSVRFGIPMSQVIVGNGSDELIGNIGLALIDDLDDEVVTSEHSFTRYDAAADLAPCLLRKVRMTHDWRFDLSAIAAAINEHTKIVYIANPNNPTGTIVTRTELEAFLEDVPERVLVVLDEAYFEYARANTDYPDGREYVQRGMNVAALRTFSKVYGLAGLRIGYGFVPEYLSHAIDRVREPFDSNSLAQVAGLAALKDDQHVRQSLDMNAEGLALLELAIKREGCSVTRSFTNFHFVGLGRPAAPVFQALMKKGYIVRPVPDAPNHLRITVGTPEENQGFIQAFREVMGG